jgi:hypothetical protein
MYIKGKYISWLPFKKMKNTPLIKKYIIELFWIAGNLAMAIKYFIDKLSVQCEPCADINNCPPCQTDFMRDFWIYLSIYNLLITVFFLVQKYKR